MNSEYQPPHPDPPLSMRSAMALLGLRICADSPEPSLLDNAIIIKILYAWSILRLVLILSFHI